MYSPKMVKKFAYKEDVIALNNYHNSYLSLGLIIQPITAMGNYLIIIGSSNVRSASCDIGVLSLRDLLQLGAKRRGSQGATVDQSGWGLGNI